MDILNRWTGQVIASGDTIKSAAEQAKSDLYGANLRGANLRGADLYSADLYSADLYCSDLRGARLRGADLYSANLRGSRLRGADLYGADLYGSSLRGADLRGAGLYGADLRGADLREAKLNWQSHDLLAEIMRQVAGDDIEKRKIAGLILVSRDWCWDQFLAAGDPLTAWALDVLRPWAEGDEHAPVVLRGEKV